MIEKTLREELNKARKERNQIAVNILGLVLGELQTAATREELSENDEIAIVKKIVKSNNTTIKSAGEGEAADTLKKENEILSQFLPQKLSQDKIMEIIGEQGIELDSNIGKSMGKVIGVLKKEGKEFDANDVRNAIQALLK